jgi:hypothetical protein
MPTDWTRWHKSTHSGGGNDCLEQRWHKSSFSIGADENCVEARALPQAQVQAEVRDTKARWAGSLTFGNEAWKTFLARIA